LSLESSELIVVLDTRVLGAALLRDSARTGVYRYVHELLLALVAGQQCKLHLLICPYQPLEHLRLLNGYLGTGGLAGIPRIGARLTLFLASLTHLLPALDLKVLRWITRRVDQFLLSYWVQGQTCVLLHLPYFGVPRSIKGHRWLIVRTVHDLIPLLHPQWFPASVQRSASADMKELPNSSAIIVVSEATRRDLLQFFPVIDPSIVYATPLAISDSFAPSNPDDLRSFRCRHGVSDEAFVILTVVTNHPRKNLTTLLLAFQRLIENSNFLLPIQLVVVGGHGWLADPLDLQVRELGLELEVKCLKFLVDAELSLAYGSADLFVYLSQYEGFGLPVLEAMACGCPVICSNTTSLPEVVGDAAVLVNPLDIEAVCEAMKGFILEPMIRDRYRQLSLERVKYFSWEKTASATIEVYQKASMLQPN